MLTIVYCKDGEPFSDFEIVEFVKNEVLPFDYIKTNDFIYTSTENLIFEIRVAVYKGLLDHEYVQINRDDKIIKLNKEGNFLNYYSATHFDISLDALLGLD